MTTAEPHPTFGDPIIEVPAGALDWSLIEDRAHARWQFIAKRCLDLIVAIPVTVVLAALFPLFALAIRLDSPGPIIFRQDRLGRDGRRFTAFKFRSMEQDAEAHFADVLHLSTGDGPAFKAPADPRITRVGYWLRRSSMDELPQVICVLLGDMSVVGPRPVLHIDFEGYEEALEIRSRVKPGMTGLWQVSGRSSLPFADRARLDVVYAKQWSIWMDVVTLVRTVPAVLTGRGAM